MTEQVGVAVTLQTCIQEGSVGIATEIPAILTGFPWHSSVPNSNSWIVHGLGHNRALSNPFQLIHQLYHSTLYTLDKRSTTGASPQQITRGSDSYNNLNIRTLQLENGNMLN
jgi:hypothetical protein